MKRIICMAALAALISACGSGSDNGITGIGSTNTGHATQQPPPTPDPVVIDQSKFLVLTGETLDLGKHVTSPSSANLTWTSSDPTIASVSNGLVLGHGFGVVSVHIASTGGAATEVEVWVANPVTSFASAVQGCPTAAETLFVSKAIPYTDFSGDATSAQCAQTTGTVLMSKFRAMHYRSIVAMAGLKMNSFPWAPNSSSVFEWFIRDSKLLGIHIVTGIKNSGECCENVQTPNGLVWGAIIVSADNVDKTYDTRAYAAYIALLLHEARHVVFGGHRCRNLLDHNMAEQGPFAVEYQFVDWLSKSPTLTPDEQVREASYAANVLATSFCNDA